MWTWKHELESRAAQFDAGTVRHIADAEMDDRRSEVGRMIARDCAWELEHRLERCQMRLRRSERWADALLWFFMASLFGNILQFWN